MRAALIGSIFQALSAGDYFVTYNQEYNSTACFEDDQLAYRCHSRHSTAVRPASPNHLPIQAEQCYF